jgi:prepilin-type N-terminal cleavage/methylation domain-containing protein/prepilin-type processing-associated H-X9-DG protein
MNFSDTFSARRQGAFTLVELLTVIAIIALLAAILFPVFVSIREDARKATCLSNMKQIGTALLMYTHDHDEVLPRVYFANSPHSTSDDDPVSPSSIVCDAPKWLDVIHPYIKNPNIFNCPSDIFADMQGKLWDGTPFNLAGNKRYVFQAYGPATRERDCGDPDGRTNVGKRYGSYAMNKVYWRYAFSDQSDQFLYTPPEGQPLAKISVPAETILICEMQGMAPSADFNRLDLIADPQPNQAIYSFPQPLLLNRRNRGGIIGRHHGKTNTIWCDGHVKSENINHLAEMRVGTNLMFRFTIQDD